MFPLRRFKFEAFVEFRRLHVELYHNAIQYVLVFLRDEFHDFGSNFASTPMHCDARHRSSPPGIEEGRGDCEHFPRPKIQHRCVSWSLFQVVVVQVLCLVEVQMR